MYPKTTKRLMDVLISLFFLFILGWLMLIIVIAYVVTKNYPFLFKQERIGLNNTSFLMWKFRTLSLRETLPLNQRTFLLGQWMRKTNLDELPQLWNVVKGDMSLIGPRPLPIAYLSRFTPVQLIRHNIKPGITGLAQISGKNFLKWTDKFRYDCFYVNKVSFMLDAYIICKTIKVVFFPYKDYSLEEEEFIGSNKTLKSI